MVKKRRTPVDDPAILQDWIELHRHNIEEVGMSKRQSYCLIGKQYGCYWTTPKYWVEPKIRDASIRRINTNRIPYSKDPRVEERRIHSRIYSDLRRQPAEFLKEDYSGRDVEPSLNEITDCLHKLTGIEICNKTLHKIIGCQEQKYGKKILVENGCRPPVNRLIH